MYHIQDKNQAKLEKNLNKTRFSYKHLHIDYYPASCTPTQQKIFNYIRQYQYRPWIKLSNEHVANAVGCSVITVIRATNKFHKDGFILKHQENRYTSNNYTLRIIVEHKNKRIFHVENDRPIKKSSLLNNLFINLTPSSRERRFFIKINEEKKGMRMDNYSYKQVVITKPKEKTPQKRNTGGHSPAVVKPTQSLEAQIHNKKVDIAFFRVQIEKPETFWDPRSFLFSVQVKMTESLLLKAIEELKDLEEKQKLRSSDEKQSILHQNSSNSMATCSA